METDFRKFSIAFVALFVAACTTLEPVPEPGQDGGIGESLGRRSLEEFDFTRIIQNISL